MQLDIPPQASPVTQVSVLLEGTPSGVAERARRMAELLSAAQMSDGQFSDGQMSDGRASPAVTISDTPPAGWGQLPPAGTVIGVSFWVAALGDVLNALLAAGAQAGVRFAVTGPAGAGLVYACLDPDCGLDPAADHDAAAARFVTALRERLAPAGGPGESAPHRSGPRGAVTVLAAPEPVRAAAGAYGAVPAGANGAVPGFDLMRAVKDQFDPEHRMFPGRFPWGQ